MLWRYLALGVAYLARGDLSKALEALSAAVRLRPFSVMQGQA